MRFVTMMTNVKSNIEIDCVQHFSSSYDSGKVQIHVSNALKVEDGCVLI